MNSRLILSVLFYFLFLTTIFAQLPNNRQNASLNGVFDLIADTRGNYYDLADLKVGAPNSGTSSINSLSSYSCNAGYFNLYFAAGSCFDGAAGAPLSKRQILCQLFSDISGFIVSPLSVPSNTVRINIYCDDVPSGSNVLGTGGSFIYFANSPSNPNQGTLHTVIQQIIRSGVDPYVNLPLAVWGAQGMYHGVINAIPSPPSGNWNYNTTTTTIANNEVDFYAVMFHEVIHALGFGSFIGQNGNSLFGAANNYFSVYDNFLTDAAGNPLIAPTNTLCPSSGLTFTASPTVINPSSCTGSGSIIVTACSTAVRYSSSSITPVFTPSCFVNGSSLSHFEDMCGGYYSGTCTPSPSSPGYNDLYFLMSNAKDYGSCYVKRYPTEEERLVLCDIGYSVNATFTSNVTGAAHTYTNGACSGNPVWGQHDGIVGTTFLFTTTGTIITIPTASLESNDSPSATVTCPEVIWSNTANAAAVVLSGTNLVVTANQGSGFVMLKYIPVVGTQRGNITYVYTYFISANCSPIDPCNMVQNGTFEATSGAMCGDIAATSGPTISCWRPHLGSVDLMTRSCTGSYNLGTNTYNSLPVVDSYNGAPNNHVLSSYFQGGNGQTETAVNYLGTPLIPGQSYQLSLMAYNFAGTSLGTTFNQLFEPVVVSIGASPNYIFLPQTPYPTGLSPLANFTLNACNVWTALTTTFVFSPTNSVNHNAIAIGPNANGYPYASALTHMFTFFDNVQLIPLPAPSFSLPPTIPCTPVSFTNLAQYTGTTVGVFSGAGVTYTNSQYHFNSPPSLPDGNYPVTFTYTNSTGCVLNLVQNVSIVSAISLSTAGTATFCSNLESSFTLTCSHAPLIAGLSYTWLPGNYSSPIATIAPTASQIYTVNASIGSCNGSSTLAVIYSSVCCPPSTITPVSTTLIPSNTVYSTPLEFLNSFTIQSGTSLDLLGSEFVFAPGTKITVPSGSTLNILGSHLYSCSNDLWGGIEVLNGGKILLDAHPNTDVNNLIEDAINAVKILSQTNSAAVNVLIARNTTFNRNYVSINISSFQSTVSTYPFTITDCVFMSRDLSSNTVAPWPQATVFDLRLPGTSTPTTGLVSPYLWQGYPTSNIKRPYYYQPSFAGIYLTNIGVTTGTVFYGLQIGTASPANFNLFDSHSYGVYCQNTNIKLVNNVFQNTLRYSIIPNAPGIYAGIAVQHSAGVMNSNLDISANNVNIGNRFWNCHTAVKGINTLRFWMDNSLIRAAQSTSSTPFEIGNIGVHLQSNRFQYYIHNSEFTNINTAINVPLSPGTFTSTGFGTVNGIYGERLAILSNTISATNSASTFCKIGINITSPLNTPVVFVPDYTVSPYTKGIVIEQNTLTGVYRGIAVNGIFGFQTNALENVITLRSDNTYNVSQHGINFSNCISSANAVGQHVISSNTLTGAVPSTSLESLVYCSLNPGLFSPSVTCNSLSNSYQGFVFLGSNPMTTWAANKMQPLTRGMVLSGSVAVIGTQGSNAFANNNLWSGTWVSNTNFGTYVNLGSTATMSPLWTKTLTGSMPPNNGGTAVIPNQYGSFFTYTVSTGGDHLCGSGPNNRVYPIPNSDIYEDASSYYAAKSLAYRVLRNNDSIVASDPSYDVFISDQSSTTIETFFLIEKKLNSGALTDAATLLGSIESDDISGAEYSSYLFCTLMYDYLRLSEEEKFSVIDSTYLIDLAGLCPETHGQSVYQARALYNSIYGIVLTTNDCGESTGARSAIEQDTKTKATYSESITIFPNPAQNVLQITTKEAEDQLTIEIRDALSRLVYCETVKSNNYQASISMDLAHGVYFISVKNARQESSNQKLIIQN